MPIYEFKCEKCGRKKETLLERSMGNVPLECDCSGRMKRVFSTFMFTHGVIWNSKQIGERNESLGQIFHTAHEKKMFMKAHPNITEDPKYPIADIDKFSQNQLPSENKVKEFVCKDNAIGEIR